MKKKGEIIFIVISVILLVVIGFLIATTKPKGTTQSSYSSFSWNTGESVEITYEPTYETEEGAPDLDPAAEPSVEIHPEDYITPTASDIVLPPVSVG